VAAPTEEEHQSLVQRVTAAEGKIATMEENWVILLGSGQWHRIVNILRKRILGP